MATLVPVQGDPFAQSGPKFVPVDHDPFAQARVGTGEDIARSGLAGVQQGAVAIPGTFGDLPLAAENAMDWAIGLVPGGKRFVEDTKAKRQALGYHANMIPTSGQLAQQVAKVDPSIGYQPQTVAGQYARTLGQFAPNALTPGGLVTKALAVAAPALTSETAGQIIRKVAPKYETAARVAGALVGGAGAGAVSNSLKGSTRTIANATEDLTDAQLANAVALAKKSRDIGVPLTAAEAIKTAAPQTRLDQALRDVEGSEQGTALRAQFGERPAAVQDAGGKMLDAVASAGNPVEIGLRGQTGAEGAIGALEGQRSAAVNPAYTAAGPQQVPAAEIDSLVTAIRDQASKDKTGLLGPTLQGFADRFTPKGSNAPITDIENLDRIRKFYRDKMTLPPGSADALPKEVSGSVSPYLQRLSQIMESASPDFASGKASYQKLSQALVNPAEAGPLGAIKGTPDVGTQTRALFPSQPPEGQAAVTGEALGRLGAQDKTLPADLTRQHLARALAEQTQNNMGGPNQWGGAKFAANVAGNPEQAKALSAALQVSAPGAASVGANTAAQKVADTLDVLKATGARLPPGSSTAERLQAASDMKQGEFAGAAIGVEASPWVIAKNVIKWAEDITQQGNRKRLADFFLTDPDNYTKFVRSAQSQYATGRMSARVYRSILMNAEAVKTEAQNRNQP